MSTPFIPQTCRTPEIYSVTTHGRRFPSPVISVDGREVTGVLLADRKAGVVYLLKPAPIPESGPGVAAFCPAPFAVDEDGFLALERLEGRVEIALGRENHYRPGIEALAERDRQGERP